jgi:hypothetical protein
VSLFELVFVIAPTAERHLAVSSSFMGNGLGQTSKSSGKLRPTMDADLSDMRVKALRSLSRIYRDKDRLVGRGAINNWAAETRNWTKRREPWLSPIASAEQAKEDARDANGERQPVLKSLPRS